MYEGKNLCRSKIIVSLSFKNRLINALKDPTLLNKPGEGKLQKNCHLTLTIKCI